MSISASKSTAFETFCQVSEQDLDRVERVTDEATHKDFYIVRSDTPDALVEYQVRDLSTCTCETPNCEHIQLAIAYDTEAKVAMATQTLLQARAILRQQNISADVRENARFTEHCATKELNALGAKVPGFEHPAWMMRDPGPMVGIENDFVDE